MGDYCKTGVELELGKSARECLSLLGSKKKKQRMDWKKSPYNNFGGLQTVGLILGKTDFSATLEFGKQLILIPRIWYSLYRRNSKHNNRLSSRIINF